MNSVQRGGQGARQNMGGAFQNNFFANEKQNGHLEPILTQHNQSKVRGNMGSTFYNTGKAPLQSTSFSMPRPSNGSNNGMGGSNPTTASGINGRDNSH